MQTQYTKQTIKQAFKASLGALTVAAAIGTIGIMAHTACSYMTPVRTETREITGCIIVSSTYGSDFPTVSYLTPQGKLGTASLPKELERIVVQQLYTEGKSIPATMKESTYTYKNMFGTSISIDTSIKSLEGMK